MEVTYQWLDSISGFVFGLLTMQVLKQIDQTRKCFMLTVRIVFVTSQLLTFLMLQYIKSQIVKRNDARKLKLKKKDHPFMVTEEDQSEFIEITVRDFDLGEVNSALKQCGFQSVLILFINYKWGVIQPLVIQAFGLVKSFFLNPLYIAYVRGIPVLRPYSLNKIDFSKLFSKPAVTITPRAKKGSVSQKAKVDLPEPVVKEDTKQSTKVVEDLSANAAVTRDEKDD